MTLAEMSTKSALEATNAFLRFCNELPLGTPDPERLDTMRVYASVIRSLAVLVAIGHALEASEQAIAKPAL